VLSLDASRLARNNHDWHQLLELCSLFGVLIADAERIYDPCAYYDRLLLGLSGIMSEAELHQIKLRPHQGKRQKAARGELRLPLPAGLVYGRDGRVALNPDEEVRARLLHLFAKFRELRSAKAVMRHFQEANLGGTDHRFGFPWRWHVTMLVYMGGNPEVDVYEIMTWPVMVWSHDLADQAMIGAFMLFIVQQLGKLVLFRQRVETESPLRVLGAYQ
jgi:hypothetical protein